MIRKKSSRDKNGFTLIELMIAMAIIAFLAVMVIPKMGDVIEKARIARIAYHFKVYIDSFRIYYASNQNYPLDKHNQLPPEMNPYLNKEKFEGDRPLGGQWNWEGADTYDLVALSIYEPTADQNTLKKLDKILDDGDLNTGQMRYGILRRQSDWRFTFYIDGDYP